MKQQNKYFNAVVTEIFPSQIITNQTFKSYLRPSSPAAPPLSKTPYVSVDQLQKFSVTMVYDYMRISLREGLQEE